MENVVFAAPGPWQIALIVFAVVLLFGARKLPELMKGMGKGIKGFKDEMNGTADTDSSEKTEE